MSNLLKVYKSGMPKARNMAGSWGGTLCQIHCYCPSPQIFRPSNIPMSFENAYAIRIYFSSEIISTQYEISTQRFLTFDRCCEWALNIHGRSNNFRQTDSVYRKLFSILFFVRAGHRADDFLIWIRSFESKNIISQNF